ncbi:hypothetical protein HDU86_001859 [Geranomyces michiganensis]|nr:hypothetical protein HDU86_001859 [Geranomyces michiganensis]
MHNNTTCIETQTSTLSAFNDFTQVVAMYAWETALREHIVASLMKEDVSSLDRRVAMLALTAWLQQPYMEVERLAEVDELWAGEMGVVGAG